VSRSKSLVDKNELLPAAPVDKEVLDAAHVLLLALLVLLAALLATPQLLVNGFVHLLIKQVVFLFVLVIIHLHVQKNVFEAQVFLVVKLDPPHFSFELLMYALARLRTLKVFLVHTLANDHVCVVD